MSFIVVEYYVINHKYVCASVGRALCLEYRVSWVESHPRQLIFLRKGDCLGVLCCIALLFV